MHARRALAAAVAFAFAASLPSQPWVNYGCSFCENTAVDSPIASYCTDCDGLDISSTMVITWTNDNSTVDVVQFGTAPGTYSSTSAAPLYHSYSTPPVLGKKSTLPAFTSALIQRVTIIGLAPATRYFYRIGSDATGWSAEASFLSHPGVGANVPVKVLMLADMDVQCFDGKVCNPQAVRDALVLPSARAALGALGINGGAVFAGDLSYANGNQTHWDAWQEFIAPLSANLPIMTNAGNRALRAEAVGARTAASVLTPAHDTRLTPAHDTRRRGEHGAGLRRLPDALWGDALRGARQHRDGLALLQL